MEARQEHDRPKARLLPPRRRERVDCLPSRDRRAHEGRNRGKGSAPRLTPRLHLMARPTPDLLARPAVCGHPAGMILTRAPSRAPFTSAVKITPGPQTCSRAPVGSPASALRFGLVRAPHEPPTSISPSRRMSAKRMLWQGCGYRRGDSLATENACR